MRLRLDCRMFRWTICDHDHREGHAPKKADAAPNELAEPWIGDDDLPFTPPQEVEFRLDTDHEQFRQFDIDQSTRSDADESLQLAAESDGPLTPGEPFSYLYPEWDFRAGALSQPMVPSARTRNG